MADPNIDTCDNCGRDFKVADDSVDVDEVLCPACRSESAAPSETDVVQALIEAIDDADPDALAGDFEVRDRDMSGYLTRDVGFVVRDRTSKRVFIITVQEARR